MAVSSDVPADGSVVRIERMVAGGEGLARHADGHVVLVRGAVVDDLVRVATVAAHRRWERAEVVEVLSGGSGRVTPFCPSRLAGCGGCDWQHIDARHHLDLKVAVAVDSLRRIAGRAVPEAADLVVAGGTVSPTGYRTTVRVIGEIDGTPGFRLERSHGLISARPCGIVHPALAAMLATIEIGAGIEAVVRVGVASGERLAVGEGAPDAVGSLDVGVATGHDAAVHEEVAGVMLRVSAGSFFQSGPEAATLLVETLRRLVPEIASADHLVDAYGGIGMFAAALAPPTARVTVIESSPAAVADARVNLLGRRASIIHGDVERWRPPAHGRPDPVDVVIADPARTGLGPRAVAAITARRPSIIALVSCDVAAGARDLGLLVAEGYRPRAIEVLDLFPQTHHLEMVSILVRRHDPMVAT